MKEEYKKIYEYTRGDISNSEFNNYFFSDIKYQEFFGNEFWLEIAECDFNNKNQEYNIKIKLEKFADSKNENECNCIKLRNIDAIDMFVTGEKHFNTITKIYDRGGHYWWLYIGLCEKCNQYWLIAQEERINDVIIFHRVKEDIYNQILEKNLWPNFYDKYIDLLRVGSNFGHKVRFIEPYEGFAVYETVKDIAKEEPNVKISEIQELINLDTEDARKICLSAMEHDNVNINMKE